MDPRIGPATTTLVLTIMPRTTPHSPKTCPVCGRLFRPALALGRRLAARQRCCSHQCAAARQHARRQEANDPPPPNEIEILILTARIRAGWSEEEETSRQVGGPVPWTVPEVADPDLTDGAVISERTL